jgi:hypothetical protein
MAQLTISAGLLSSPLMRLTGRRITHRQDSVQLMAMEAINVLTEHSVATLQLMESLLNKMVHSQIQISNMAWALSTISSTPLSLSSRSQQKIIGLQSCLM